MLFSYYLYYDIIYRFQNRDMCHIVLAIAQILRWQPHNPKILDSKLHQNTTGEWNKGKDGGKGRKARGEVEDKATVK